MKHIKKLTDSKSLWNYTLSPGWTLEEVEVLKVALMKFGIGKWKRIKRSNCLPGKTIAQMNLQTQRLLGQQSLAEFMGLKLNLEKIYFENKAKQSKEILRKNNFIINTGDNLTLDDRKLRLKLNQKRFGMDRELLKSLKIPKLLSQSIGHFLTIKQLKDPKNNLSIVEKINGLKNLISCMNKKLRIIKEVEVLRNLNGKSFLSNEHSISNEEENNVMDIENIDNLWEINRIIIDKNIIRDFASI